MQFGATRMDEIAAATASFIRSPSFIARRVRPLRALVPYVVATVKLAEGPHLMTNIIGCAPDAVRIGMPVRVVFRKMSDEITLPMFEPVAADA